MPEDHTVRNGCLCVPENDRGGRLVCGARAVCTSSRPPRRMQRDTLSLRCDCTPGSASNPVILKEVYEGKRVGEVRIAMRRVDRATAAPIY